MNLGSRSALLLVLGVLVGCANPDSVLFVTSSTIGINVDNKPPTASIGYDRVEGYIGPRYDNGAIAPVVASLELGGNVFDPHIRQVYATGAAAVKAVGTLNADPGQTVLTGDPAKKRLVFFGTTTTIGLKAGFSGGGYPDSLTFGYKRKEFSFIPLGSKIDSNGQVTDTYPSVLASIDTTANAQARLNTGLTSQQFFATGQAAETLATNSAVSGVFNVIAANAITASLTPAQQQAAITAGVEASTTQNAMLVAIMKAIAPNGTVDMAKLASVVDTANAKMPESVPTDLKNATTAAQVQTRIGNDQVAVASMYNVVKAQPTQ